MNGLVKRFTAIASAVMATALSTLAQTNPPTLSTPERAGRVVAPDTSQKVDAVNATSLKERPKLAERNELSPEVRAQLQRFQQEARKYLEQQEALRKRLQGATEEERVRVRQQLQNLREQWLERARELRKQFRDRQSELIEKLPSHREVLESVRDAAKQSALEQLRDELKNQQQQGRDRRGQD